MALAGLGLSEGYTNLGFRVSGVRGAWVSELQLQLEVRVRGLGVQGANSAGSGHRDLEGSRVKVRARLGV